MGVRWIAIVLGCLGSAATAAGEEFHSTGYGYGIEIPEGWVQISPAVLEETMAKLQGQGPQRIRYDAGFQLEAAERWLEYPYVLVQPIPYTDFGMNRQMREDEFPEFIQALTGQNIQQAFDETVSPEAGHLLSGMQAGAPELDRARRQFSLTIDSEVQGVGPIRGLTLGSFGRRGIIQVTFYARTPDWDGFDEARRAFLASFHFEEGDAYSEEAAAAGDDGRSPWSGRLRKALAAGIAAAVLGGVIGALVVRKRQKA